MKLLLIDDDPDIRAVFENEFSGVVDTLTCVGTRDAAISEIETNCFDLIVCDLKIPSSDGRMAPREEHGTAVITSTLEKVPGTPLIALSAIWSVPLLQELAKSVRREDCFGEGSARLMLDFWRKDQLPDCIRLIHEINNHVQALDAIQISWGRISHVLEWEQQRIVRIYARRLGATVIHATMLKGGLSGSCVLALRLESQGAHVAHVVAKIGNINDVADEDARVERHVTPILQSGAYPSAVKKVDSGAGDVAGLFYSFANRHSRPLFDIAADVEPTGSPEVVKTLSGLMEPWRIGAPVGSEQLGDIRRLLISDADLMAAGYVVGAEESMMVETRKVTAHGDLHPFNVLLSDANSPLVIDFGRTGPGPASLDPITLELALLFHPDAVGSSWPTIDQARQWEDESAYLADCPYRSYVESCREWAADVAAGDRERYGVLYAYSLRQLKFDETDHSLAHALVECAKRLLTTP